MGQQSIRDTLIQRTIAVIAVEGLDKTTTKSIVAGTGINEVYIYRYFSHKEGLLSSAFEELDNELVSQTLRHSSVMGLKGLNYETRSRLFFFLIWNFLLGNREKCLAFVRYYYSPYFQRLSVDAHRQRYKPLVERFSLAFRQDADVWMILNHILNVMLDFAVKVHNGQMPENDDYAEHVFRVVYVSVKQYFRTNEEGSAQYEEST